jgi:hypothetical protein
VIECRLASYLDQFIHLSELLPGLSVSGLLYIEVVRLMVSNSSFSLHFFCDCGASLSSNLRIAKRREILLAPQ